MKRLGIKGLLWLAVWGWVGGTVLAAELPGVPETPKKPVTDTYHGVKVPDDYRWLEDWNDPAVRAWSEAQNSAARAYLDSRPGLPALRERIGGILRFPAVRYHAIVRRGKEFFALKMEPPKQQPVLVRFRSFDDLSTEKTILDPVSVDAKGTTTIDLFEPSLDGRLVAVSLSKCGSESGDVSVYETESGRKLPDMIPRVHGGTAGGSLAWSADSSGFFYTRYPRAGERPAEDLGFYQQVYFHKLGAPGETDTYAIGREFPRIAEVFLDTSEDGRAVSALVANGDGGEFSLYLLPPGGSWIQVARFEDKVVGVRFGRDGALYLLSRKGASRGKLLRVPLSAPALDKAIEIVPEGKGVITSYLPAATRLYVVNMLGGPSELSIFGLDGKPLGTVPTAPVSSVGGLVSPGGDELFYNLASYTLPSAWYRYWPGVEKPSITAIQTRSPVDLSGITVLREEAVSKDGTRVPMTVIRNKDSKQDGSSAALLYGYGGYGISMAPSYNPMLAIWLEHGGVYAIANLRGGGEFGEGWHLAGNLTRKQNVFDDFLACARRMVDLRYAAPGRLAIMGGSNGGLLMGAALTQEPSLFRAVVSRVGIYDMLRVELSPNGAFNVTEFGTVKDPEQFRALMGYSPYHHVQDGVKYPALLLTSGANDPRVDPLNSRKFAARMQAASVSGWPVFLRTSSDSGHGLGNSLDQTIAETVDIYAFLFDQLGMK